MAMKYRKELLNYFRICYGVTDVVTDGLRIIFKQEWDNRYGATTSGEWKDEPRNGVDFIDMESRLSKRRNAHHLRTMIGGNRAEWDCAMLFYAILYSDCIYSLSSVVRTNVNALRKIVFGDFRHIPKAFLSDLQFQDIIGRVDTAFQALGLSTMKIREIKNQTSFPTVDDPKQELQVSVDQLNVKVPKPLNPCCDISAQLHFLLIITECILSY